MNKSVAIVILILLMIGCGKSGVAPKSSAERDEEVRLLGIKLVSQVVELSTTLPEDDVCQLRFATDEEIEILKQIRKLPVEERLSVLSSTIEQMSAGELDHLPIEYVSHAVVGADTKVRSKVIQEILVPQIEAFETDSRLASICARVALDLDAVDQVSALLIPAVKVVSKKMPYPRSYRDLGMWITEFDELMKLAPKAQYPIILEALLDAYSESFDSFVTSARANPSENGVQFQKTFSNLQRVASFAGDVGNRLSDEQLIATSQLVIERLASLRWHGISERVNRLGIAPSETSEAQLNRDLAHKELLDISAGSGNGDGLSLASMEDLVTTIKPDSFKLAQLNQLRVPTEELSLEIRQELAEIVVKKLKDEKNLPGSLYSIAEILKTVIDLIPEKDVNELFNKLLPNIRQFPPSPNFSPELLQPICGSLRGDNALAAIEKVMELKGRYSRANVDLVLSSLFRNLKPDEAQKFLKRIQEMDLLLSKISLISRFSPKEGHVAFTKLFEEARAIKDPVERLKVMAKIGTIAGHSQPVAKEFFKAYVKEFVQICDKTPNQPSWQGHSRLSIERAFRERVGALDFVNEFMGYLEKVNDWAPCKFTDEILGVIASGADMLTREQAVALVDTWANVLDRDKSRNQQTIRSFSLFLGGRPESERPFFFSKVIIPSVMSDDLKSRPRGRFDRVGAPIAFPIKRLASNHVKDIYLAALKRSSELPQLDGGDGSLLFELAQAVPESGQHEVVDATIEMLNMKKEKSFLVVYTSCLSKLETTFDEQMTVFSVWEEFFDSGQRTSMLPLAELLEGIKEPEASKINAKILDWNPRQIDVLALIKPNQDGKDVVPILNSVARLYEAKSHPTSLEAKEASLKKIYGTMPAGSSLAQLSISRELIAGPRPSVYTGVKLIESAARFVHPDDAKKWYALTFHALKNCYRSDRFRSCAEALHLLGKKLTLEDSVKYFDSLLELEKYFAVKKNYSSIEHALTPLLVNIANQDYSEFEKKLALVEEVVSPDFKQKIDEGLLALATDERNFIRIADRCLEKADDQTRQKVVEAVLDVALDKPILQSVKLVKQYGCTLENQNWNSIIRRLGEIGPGCANRPTLDELRQAYDLPESVGVIRSMIEHRNPRPARPASSRNNLNLIGVYYKTSIHSTVRRPAAFWK